MPTRSLLCHKRRKLPIYTKPLFMQIPGPCCGTVWGAVTPPLYPALFSTPRLTPIWREILNAVFQTSCTRPRQGVPVVGWGRDSTRCLTAAHGGAQAAAADPGSRGPRMGSAGRGRGGAGCGDVARRGWARATALLTWRPATGRRDVEGSGGHVRRGAEIASGAERGNC